MVRSDGRVQLINEDDEASATARHPGAERIAAPYFFSNRYATTASDSTLVFWDQNLGETARVNLPYRAEGLKMSWDGKFVATAGGGSIDVWTIEGGLAYTSRGSNLVGISGNSVVFRQAGRIYTRKFTQNQTITQFEPSGQEYAFGRGYNQLFALNPAGTHVLRWGTTSDAFDEIEICLSTAADTALYREHRARQFAFHGQFEALDAELFQLDSANISDSLRRARTANIATVLYNRALLAMEQRDAAFACELIDRAIEVDGSRTPIYLQAREVFCLEEEASEEVVTITGELRNFRTGDPVVGATVTAGAASTRADNSGRFRLELRGPFASENSTLTFSAPGFPDRTFDVSGLQPGATIDIGQPPWASLPEGAELEIRAQGDQYGLWLNGSWVLEPVYRQIERDQRSGYFRLSGTTSEGERRVGMANPQGEVVVPLSYQSIQFPNAGLIGAQSPSTNLWGYLSAQTGEQVIRFDFEEVQPFDDVVASVTSGGSSFLINREGLCIQDCPDDYLRSVLEAYLQGNYGDMASLRSYLLNHPQLDRMLTLAMDDDFLGDFDEIPTTLDDEQRLAFDRLQELFNESTRLDAATVAKYQELFNLMRNVGKVQDMSGELPPPIAEILPEMVEVPGGTFVMGNLEGRDGQLIVGELQPHEVQIDDFSIGKYEVTNRQYVTFLNFASLGPTEVGEWYKMSESGARISNTGKEYTVSGGYENHPVTHVTRDGARAFARWLSDQTGNVYRLPTEAEWEYAARGAEKGATEKFKYSGSNSHLEVSWHRGTSTGDTHPVGQKLANQLGIYDMSGNVWELVQDCWDENYQEARTDGSAWVNDDCTSYVIRGGAWNDYNSVSTLTSRDRSSSKISSSIGFRLALSSR